VAIAKVSKTIIFTFNPSRLELPAEDVEHKMGAGRMREFIHLHAMLFADELEREWNKSLQELVERGELL
jgi:hypothetical protein